jgi:predicted small lipoprotein YifL
LIAMPRAVPVLLAAGLAALLLAACGNKGPLVLPDQAPKHKKGQPAQKAPEQKTPEQKSPDPKAAEGSGNPDAQH